MLKAEDRLEAAVKFCCPQVQATTPEIAVWVGDMVGRLLPLVERSRMGEGKFIGVKMGGHLM